MTTRMQQLGQYVRKRRDELGLSQMQIWKDRGGPSSTKLGQIENGDGPEPTKSTIAKLEHALGWREGSVSGVLKSGIPPTLQLLHVPEGSTVNPRDWEPEELAERLEVHINTDGDGRQYLSGVYVFPVDGALTRTEVRFWPAPGHELRPVDFMGIVGDAQRAALKQSLPTTPRDAKLGLFAHHDASDNDDLAVAAHESGSIEAEQLGEQHT